MMKFTNCDNWIRAIAFWGMEGDSEALLQAVRFLGCGGAIAKRCCKQFAFWGCGRR
ncbi:hypothetical protein [Anabaena sp. AL93]|uniref:hypothetical protein n=1 Tax=Anabaena sp. AL93 TaxID=1678133 RepID=UPI0025BE5ABA|nr:hypothetical protein [Anabaena sp. AL93]